MGVFLFGWVANTIQVCKKLLKAHSHVHKLFSCSLYQNSRVVVPYKNKAFLRL